jgi:hypothetical protein
LRIFPTPWRQLRIGSQRPDVRVRFFQTLSLHVPIGSVTFLNCMRLSSLSIRRFCAVLQAQVAENEIGPKVLLDSLLDTNDGEVEDDYSSVPVASSDDIALNELEQCLLTRDTMTFVFFFSASSDPILFLLTRFSHLQCHCSR